MLNQQAAKQSAPVCTTKHTHTDVSREKSEYDMSGVGGSSGSSDGMRVVNTM